MAAPDIIHHSLTGQSAWQDLLRLLKDAEVSDIRGKPTLRPRDSRGYWYDRYRVGDRIVERYIGEDSATGWNGTTACARPRATRRPKPRASRGCCAARAI